ncbi:hypothetical protein BK139_07455 [Paenibacillus sp. FSL R5-0490]|uniref:hypothetical protein n=1 Tax=Bacillales TaxID=1385 RepID=UPI00096DFEB3|nr:hypothetical protein [Paenibacillus sp. FSL R5-0490]OMF61190.1 hypothetical protein BK139_07455 [Paenibacillus sp. FSL R5-0490]
MTSVIGWIISGIFSIVVGMTFAMIIATLNKKVVRDKWGKIDFKKTDIYFYWTRWDTIMVISAVYTFLCITGLLVFLLRGDTIQSPFIQFFIHQSFVFGLITFIWLITKLAYVYKGIQKRWSDEFE